MVSSGLANFAADVFSQAGEDGIIEEALKRIEAHVPLDKWCVEFGAWDGRHLSNTCRLIEQKDYSAVLIEGNPSRFETLCRNFPQKDVVKVCQLINFQGESTLDNVLGKTPIPEDFDFLSIDIDGCDYYIFESLKKFRPKLVCIEYLGTAPNDVQFVQPRDFAVKQGASAAALVALARQKGYALAAVTASNLILIRSDLRAFVLDRDYDLGELRDDAECRNYVFVGFDGTLLSNREHLALPWHGTTIPLARAQLLPSLFRTFPPDMGRITKSVFKLWRRACGICSR